MLSVLLLLLRRYRIALAELVGVGFIVVNVYAWSHRAAGLVVGGVLLVKALEWDMTDDDRPRGRGKRQ